MQHDPPSLHEKRELLAELKHELWKQWSMEVAAGERLTNHRICRWEKLWVPYRDLPDAEKDGDRRWADEVIAALSQQ